MTKQEFMKLCDSRMVHGLPILLIIRTDLTDGYRRLVLRTGHLSNLDVILYRVNNQKRLPVSKVLRMLLGQQAIYQNYLSEWRKLNHVDSPLPK